MKLTVKNTVKFSLVIQLITGIITLYGLFIKLDEKHNILRGILGLETLVQFIELAFYIWIAYASVKLPTMTPRRYIDWMITTPAMLLSTIMFMKYEEKREEDKLEDESVKFWDFIKNYKTEILFISFYNCMMLVLGYIGEKNIISKYITTPIGFFFFFKSFKLIYTDFAKKSKLGKQIFTFLLSVWSLYGVAALLPIKEKNISYNLLDIVSKNFYGLFIFYKILKISN
tara:strand:- start:897 stop:1580 length:684 start_codon:yes stop_codon:yes gene_type:complete